MFMFLLMLINIYHKAVQYQSYLVMLPSAYTFHTCQEECRQTKYIGIICHFQKKNTNLFLILRGILATVTSIPPLYTPTIMIEFTYQRTNTAISIDCFGVIVIKSLRILLQSYKHHSKLSTLNTTQTLGQLRQDNYGSRPRHIKTLDKKVTFIRYTEL